jgi:hypothetical protein
MPSDTAFLGDLPAAGQLVSGYDTLGTSADVLSKQRVGGGMAGGNLFSPRGLLSTLENLRALGIDIDENNAVLKGLRAGIVTNYSLYMLYGAWTAMRKAQAAREAAYAATETAALAIAQQWHLIAQGAAAALMVTAAFAVGEKIGSGDWKLPSFDISSPVERRAAARRLAATRG